MGEKVGGYSTDGGRLGMWLARVGGVGGREFNNSGVKRIVKGNC